MAESVILPSLTSIGVFDAKIKFGDIGTTKTRRVYAFELELPIEDGGISHIDSAAYPIQSARIICAKPGQRRRTTLPFRCYYIHLICESGVLFDMLSALPDAFEVRSRSEYKKIFEEIISEYNATSAHSSQLLLYSMLLRLIHMMQTDAESVQINEGEARAERCNTAAVKKAVEYMNRHFAEKLSLKKIADEVYLSPIYFRNLFYDTVGMSPHEYIQNRRLTKAKNLLILTSMTLSEVAEASGFTSQSYFCFAFKKSFGMTPRQFRISANDKYPL